MSLKTFVENNLANRELVTNLLELDLIKLKKSNKLAIFGTGVLGKYIGQYWQSYVAEFQCFIDNDVNKQRQVILNKPVYSVADFLENYEEDTVVLICSDYYQEISDQLRNLNFYNFIIMRDFKYVQLQYSISRSYEKFNEFIEDKWDLLNSVYKLLNDEASKRIFIEVISYRMTGNPAFLSESKFEQYFHPKVKPNFNDVIIDGGAYIGDTLEKFLNELDGNGIVHSFEPALSNFKEMQKSSAKYKESSVFLVNSGLGEKMAKLYMNTIENENGDSYSVSENGNEIVHVVSIDEYVKENNIQKLDLIKLDIEGFEMEALHGAIDTISKMKPKLQICLYHKFEDLFKIPLFIHENFPDYKLYLDHHSSGPIETVLYCIYKKNV